MPDVITSASNPTIKSLAKLRKRSERDERGVFVIEGHRAITRAMQAGTQLEALYFSPDWLVESSEHAVIEAARAQNIPVTEVARDAFAKITYRERPEGLLAVARQWHPQLEALRLSENPFLILVEAIEKPGNLGTILRSADATGAEAVIVCDAVTDVFNPNVVRASTGALFNVPVFITDSKVAMNFLAKNNIRSLAATPAAADVYTDVDMTQPLALVVGSEQHGLSEQWLKQCDLPIKLPMLGMVDSLNVSAATVVLAYEVVRQRHKKT